MKFALALSNKDDAAAKAAEIFLSLASKGWEETLEKYKGGGGKQKSSTVGSLIEQVATVTDLAPRTFEDYAKSLRKIAVEIAGLSAKQKDWRSAVNRVALSRLSPGAIQKWKLDFVARAGDSPSAAGSRKTTANTLLRNARSLFSKKVVKHLPPDLVLPTPLPFAEVDFYPRQSMRYVSRIDASQLI